MAFHFFKKFPEVSAVVSERKDGSMKVFSEQSEENQENRIRFFAEQGIAAERVVSAGLVHGKNVEITTVHSVTHKPRPWFMCNNRKKTERVIPATDALVTREKNLFLAVTAADCLPVFFFDPVAGVIGIAHAGWRGIVSGVIEETLKKMSVCGAAKKNISVAIGPHIGVCHFEIQTDILPRFAQYEKYVIKKEGRIYVDLEGIAREQSQQAGILETHIETNQLCTFCEEKKLFSYRRDKPAVPEVMIAIIGMKEKT